MAQNIRIQYMGVLAAVRLVLFNYTNIIHREKRDGFIFISPSLQLFLLSHRSMRLTCPYFVFIIKEKQTGSLTLRLSTWQRLKVCVCVFYLFFIHRVRISGLNGSFKLNEVSRMSSIICTKRSLKLPRRGKNAS